MITFECCQCQEEHTEPNPTMWGECYPYSEGSPACKSCVDNYNGPGDEYYENFYESNARYEMRQEQELQEAGRL